jgi:hypothetical protein
MGFLLALYGIFLGVPLLSQAQMVCHKSRTEQTVGISTGLRNWTERKKDEEFRLREQVVPGLSKSVVILRGFGFLHSVSKG